MRTLTITVPGIPVPQGSKRAFGGRVVDSNAARLRPWRAIVTDRALQAMERDNWMTAPRGTSVSVEINFFFPRPAAHYRGKAHTLREDAPNWVTTKPDLDKIVRAIFDALTDAAVWWDDSQVVTLSASKHYAEAAPEVVRTFITVRTQA